MRSHVVLFLLFLAMIGALGASDLALGAEVIGLNKEKNRIVFKITSDERAGLKKELPVSGFFKISPDQKLTGSIIKYLKKYQVVIEFEETTPKGVEKGWKFTIYPPDKEELEDLDAAPFVTNGIVRKINRSKGWLVVKVPAEQLAVVKNMAKDFFIKNQRMTAPVEATFVRGFRKALIFEVSPEAILNFGRRESVVISNTEEGKSDGNLQEQGRVRKVNSERMVIIVKPSAAFFATIVQQGADYKMDLRIEDSSDFVTSTFVRGIKSAVALLIDPSDIGQFEKGQTVHFYEHDPSRGVRESKLSNPYLSPLVLLNSPGFQLGYGSLGLTATEKIEGGESEESVTSTTTTSLRAFYRAPIWGFGLRGAQSKQVISDETETIRNFTEVSPEFALSVPGFGINLKYVSGAYKGEKVENKYNNVEAQMGYLSSAAYGYLSYISKVSSVLTIDDEEFDFKLSSLVGLGIFMQLNSDWSLHLRYEQDQLDGDESVTTEKTANEARGFLVNATYRFAPGFALGFDMLRNQSRFLGTRLSSTAPSSGAGLSFFGKIGDSFTYSLMYRSLSGSVKRSVVNDVNDVEVDAAYINSVKQTESRLGLGMEF